MELAIMIIQLEKCLKMKKFVIILKILDNDQNFIEKLYVVLISFASGFEIVTTYFLNFCIDIAKLYVYLFMY